MKLHTLESVYAIEELYKIKPIREEKDFSKMHETNLMDQHTMRKIQMVYYPKLDNTLKKIPT